MDQGDIEQMSFEAALAELEQIVRSLEQGQAPLDESIELYQRGDRLKRHCEARLKAAQARIEQIALGPDGQPRARAPSMLLECGVTDAELQAEAARIAAKVEAVFRQAIWSIPAMGATGCSRPCAMPGWAAASASARC